MTSKLTITREQATDKEIQMLIDSHENGTAMFLRVDAYYLMAKELQERRKAELDSEPYGYVHQSVYEQSGSCGLSNDHEAYSDSKTHIPLYRHAQPAPKTEREPIAWLNDAYLARGVVDGEAGSEDAGPGYIPVYREALPAQPAPVVDIEPTQMFGIGSIFKPQVVSEQEADCDDCAHYNPKICHGEGCPAISQQSAQPAPERDQVRREHAEWSQTTFGNVGPIGPLKHLSKEALEAAAEPGDLSEWADMQFLLWDAQRRAGITDEQITQAMIEKLAVNKQREWPEPKDGEPRLHIKERPAQVIPDGYVMVPDDGLIAELLTIAKEAADDADALAYAEFNNKSMLHTTAIADWARRAAMLSAAPQSPGSEPATVPGAWIPVSERMPETDGNYWGWWSESKRQGPVWFIKSELQAQFQSHEITHWMPLPAGPQEVKGE